MKKVSFWVGIGCLGLWLIWFLIDTAPSFPMVSPIPPETVRLILQFLFVATCLALILMGLGGIKENSEKEKPKKKKSK